MEKLQAYQASAGSGKTFALTVRYISLLFLNANPSSIVALTFTKKAANEMKERIYNVLIDLENKDELNNICILTCKSKEEILNQKKQVLDIFLKSNLHVETIDAFFGKILRKFSLHLGIMPDFITTDKTHHGKLQELFIKTAYNNKAIFNSLVSFMLNEQKKLTNVFDFFIDLFTKTQELDLEKYNKCSYPNDKQMLLKSNEIADFLANQNASTKAIETFKINKLKLLQEKSFWSKESLNYWIYKKFYTPKLDEMFFELKQLYKTYCIDKQNYFLGELFRLFKLFNQVKFDLSKQTNELTFSDVTYLTYKLLHESISNDFLYFRLDNTIEHLLLDEFQDTNVLQFNILSPIIEEISAGIGTKTNKTFFYVGDTKQSIYRFRGGSQELFDIVAEKFNLTVQTLDTNYRSDGLLVNYVNKIFSQVFTNFIPQKSKLNVQNEGFLKVQTSDNLYEDIINSLSILFQNNVNKNDIAILCHTNKDATKIKSCILDFDKTLQVSIESTTNIMQTHLVKMLVEFLKYSYFGYKINQKNVLVLQGKSFQENLDIKIENFDRPLYEIIIEAVQKLDINGTNKDILYFIEMATEYENIEDFLFQIDRISQSSVNETQNGIKVLTIHKSKGLEFKHVILVDKITKTNNQSGSFLFQYQNQMLKNIYLKIKNREYVDKDYQQVLENEKLLRQNDLKNALYVAFTRARNSLFILKSQKDSSMDFLPLEDFQNGTIKPNKIPTQDNTIHVFEPIKAFGSQKSLHVNEDDFYDFKAIYFGLAFHYLLEITTSFTQEALKEAYIGVKNRYGEFINTDEVLKRALMLIKNKQFLSLIHNGKITKEQPLLYNNQRKQLDLLVEFDNKFIIIDYKTSQNTHEKHISQVKEYKQAVETITQKEVQAWLFYIKENEIFSLNI